MAKVEKQTDELQLSDELLKYLVINDELSDFLGFEKEKNAKESKEKEEKEKKDKKIIK